MLPAYLAVILAARIQGMSELSRRSSESAKSKCYWVCAIRTNDLRDIDDDSISWLKEMLLKGARDL
jgi:hypothetical protein